MLGTAATSVVELPEQTILLKHQIAGHSSQDGKIYTGMLKHADGYVMKPVQDDERGKKEVEFYEQVQHSSHPVISELREMIPHFLGLHQFICNDSVSYYIKMEDVVGSYTKPCIADIKIGRQTWDPSSSAAKRLSENNKYRGTKEPLGFCIPGMWIHEPSSGTVLKLDKRYGAMLDKTTVKDAIRLYLNGTQVLSRSLVSEFLRQLHSISAWFEKQRHFHFYATSLLLVYEAESLVTNGARASPAPVASSGGGGVVVGGGANVRVRMIDFAHVFPAHDSRDANYLEGLCNLIDVFQNLYREAF